MRAPLRDPTAETSPPPADGCSPVHRRGVAGVVGDTFGILIFDLRIMRDPLRVPPRKRVHPRRMCAPRFIGGEWRVWWETLSGF